MTTTYKIKAYSRTVNEDNTSEYTRFEYNGSFWSNEMDIHSAFNLRDRKVLLGWSEMMDCFYDVLFILDHSNETVSFNKYDY